MATWSSTAIFLVLLVQTRSQFFDIFNPNIFGNEYTTRRTKIETVRVNQAPKINWRNSTIHYSYDRIEKDNDRDVSREKKRKQQSVISYPTLQPIFNYFTPTQKPVRKTTKVSNSYSGSSKESTSIGRKKNTNKEISPSYDLDISKNSQISDYYNRPINNNAYNYEKPSYEATTKDNHYNYVTERPYYTRPGVKPVILDDRPPITNRPATRRPQTQRPYTQTQKPYTQTQKPYTQTQKPYTRTQTPTWATPKPYIVKPIPTDAGAVVFPHEDDPPEIIRGPDEAYMSDAEKRRYIELAERMCDKYKSMNTKQLSAIPLLPSPEPVSVNVSKCTPTQIPLVVGGKVVTINEFPHMALLGWMKIDSGGYSWKCGGSLISEQHILTAAHCSYEERDNTVVIGPPTVVQLGSSYLDDPGALVVRVAAIIRHPNYKFPRSYNDLAILKLLQPVTFSEVIKPACLGVPPPINEPVVATGWGKTEFSGDQSLELRSVSLPVWGLAECREVLGTSRRMPQGAMGDSQMCAGDRRGGKDTCQGDSGGPAQLQEGCIWRVVAVTSLGRSCGAPNTPGLYAKVQRAFVAAAVFGDYKNQQRPDSNQNSNQNQNHNNQNNNNGNDYQPYQNNNNRKTTESYYNNRRTTTTTTESYYKPQQYDYGQNNNNRRPNKNNNRGVLDTDAGFYYPQSDASYNNPSYNNNQGYNNQPQNGYWKNNNKRSDDRIEEGRIWYT